MLSDLLSSTQGSQTQLLKKLNQENLDLTHRLADAHKEINNIAGQKLLVEQINCQLLQQEADKIDQLERRIEELLSNLDRKEQYMQSKEKKWLEVEAFLMPYYDGDKQLEDKMHELKMETV